MPLIQPEATYNTNNSSVVTQAKSLNPMILSQREAIRSLRDRRGFRDIYKVERQRPHVVI